MVQPVFVHSAACHSMAGLMVGNLKLVLLVILQLHSRSQPFFEQVLTLELFIQELLGDPNPNSPAQSDAFLLFTQNRPEYSKRVKAQALNYPPPS